MRIISILILLAAGLGFEGNAQSLAYTYTSEGQLLFSDVIEKEKYNQEELYSFAKQAFAEKKKSKLKKDEEEKTLSLSGSFTLYEKGILSRVPSAEIQYQLFMEFKDGRYRYQYKDFAYLPYERNRYGKYEIVRRKRKSLEDMIRNEQAWSKYNEEFVSHIQTHIENVIHTMNDQLSQPKEDTANNIIQLDKEW